MNQTLAGWRCYCDWTSITDQTCDLLGRFCFCSLHAHMRLTEAIVKPMLARAISTNRVEALNEAFKQHLGLEDVFAQVQSEH